GAPPRERRAVLRTMPPAPHDFTSPSPPPAPPKGSPRTRHYGLLASARCKANIARAKELMAVPVPVMDPPAGHDDADREAGTAADHRPPCPCCGGRMIIVQTFRGGASPPPPPPPQAGGRTPVPLTPPVPPPPPRLPGNLASAVASLSPRRLRRRVRRHRSCQNQPINGRRDDKLPTAIGAPPPPTLARASLTQAAAPPNPHRRQTPHQP